MATAALLDLARQYLAVVDHGDKVDQTTKRTATHDALMAQMRLEGVPFNSRVEARWIARWLVSGKPNGIHHQSIMYTEPCDGNPSAPRKLFYSPPNDNREALVPVLVTVESFEHYPDPTYNQDA